MRIGTKRLIQKVFTWNLMAIHLLVVGYQLDDEPILYLLNWLEITKHPF